LIAIERVMNLASPALREAEFVTALDAARRGARRAMMLMAAERLMRDKAPASQQGNVGRFLAWAQKASPDERAEAASTLARAYLREPAPHLRHDAELCLTTMAEDDSALVRRALAFAFADAADAPRQIVSALASDEPEIAAIVLARTPVLSDAELADCAAIGCETVQIALARRPSLNANVAASLAEADRRGVAIALIENSAAELTPDAMARIASHFGEDRQVRDALLSRPGLPAAVRYDLIAAATRALPLAAYAFGEKRVARMMRDAMERCALREARSRPPHEVSDLMRHLRTIGALTVALLMRALVSGERDFFNAAAVELTAMVPERIAGFTREPFGSGFAALYRRMGLPRQFLAQFRAALAAADDFVADGRVLRPIVSRVIARCEGERSPELSGLLALLRRLEAEAALGEARAVAASAVGAQPAQSLDEQDAPTPQTIVIARGLDRMLALLRRLEEEAEATLAELEGAATASEAERRLRDESLNGWFETFETIDCRSRGRRTPARAGRFEFRAA
jgi:uncharacterized protein (DUF2336 family)